MPEYVQHEVASVLRAAGRCEQHSSRLRMNPIGVESSVRIAAGSTSVNSDVRCPSIQMTDASSTVLETLIKCINRSMDARDLEAVPFRFVPAARVLVGQRPFWATWL